MPTFQDLLAKHETETLAKLTEITDRFLALPNRTADNLNIFIHQNAPDYASAIANSGTNIIHEALQKGISIGADEFKAVRESNLKLAAHWQGAISSMLQGITSGII